MSEDGQISGITKNNAMYISNEYNFTCFMICYAATAKNQISLLIASEESIMI